MRGWLSKRGSPLSRAAFLYFIRCPGVGAVVKSAGYMPALEIPDCCQRRRQQGQMQWKPLRPTSPPTRHLT